MAAKKVIDWELMEADWVAGIKSVSQLSAEYGVSRAAIQKHWDKEGVARNLEAKIKADKDNGQVVKLKEPEEINASGFVYVIYVVDSAGEKYHKIGMSKVFSDRLKAHQCSSPFEVYVAIAYFVGDMWAEERILHETFKHKRSRGEWFKLDSSDLNHIASRSNLCG